jgi:putative tryptophan/tyrosine transport system substrate-binding protein
MRRREFIALMGASVTCPFAALAQEPGRIYHIGGVSSSPRNAAHFVAMFDELRRAGFVSGQNLTIDWHSYGARTDLIPEFAAELAKRRLDVLVMNGDAAIRAAQKATTTIPILGITEDMVGSGLVDSLARPSSSTTGTSIFAPELDGKRQEILIEALTELHRMAALADSKATGTRELMALQDAARARGVELSVYSIATAEEITPAIDAAKASGAAALNVLSSPFLYGNRRTIMQLVAALGLPAIYQFPEEAEEGGFIAYGPRLIQIFRELAAQQLVKLLRDMKPGDIPVEQPTKFELVINLKTANALGITVPATLVARADKVIE